MKKTTAMLTREEALAARRWFVIDARRIGPRTGRDAKRRSCCAARASRRSRRTSIAATSSSSSTPSRSSSPGQGRDDKIYYRHSGFPGGIRSAAAGSMRATHPERLLRAGGRRHAAEEPSSAGSWRPSSRSTPARSTRTRRSSRRVAGRARLDGEEGVSHGGTDGDPRGNGQAEDGGRARPARAGRGQDQRQPAHPRGLLRPPDSRMIVNQPFELTNTRDRYDVIVNVRRRRHRGAGLGDPPRHHPRADARQPRVPPAAEEGRLRHARSARGRAQEVRPAQGAQAAAVLEALSTVAVPPVARPIRSIVVAFRGAFAFA